MQKKDTAFYASILFLYLLYIYHLIYNNAILYNPEC